MKKTTEPKNKPTLVAVLLDRSGSMESCKSDTIGGFNAFVNKLKDDKSSGMIFTRTQFDSQGVDIEQDGVPIKQAALLTNDTFVPRGGTPLYDAIGKTIQSAQKQAGDKYKVLFMILTDGQENASSEWNLEGVKNLIKEMESQRHWTFSFVGIGPDAWRGADAIMAGTQSFSNKMNFKDKKDISKVMRRAGGQTVVFACSTQGVNSVSGSYWSGSGLQSEDEN